MVLVRSRQENKQKIKQRQNNRKVRVGTGKNIFYKGNGNKSITPNIY